MAIDTGAVSDPILTIEWLTFDGNRQLNSPTVSLCSSQSGVADLDVWAAGIVTVQYINFISAPWDALYIGGSLGGGGSASTVSYSSFGQGFTAQGYTRTAPQTATRWFGIIAKGNGTGIWYNSMAYVGLAAIDLYTGSGQYVVGNQMNINRYEQPDGISGGAIYIPDEDPSAANGFSGGATYASIANNLINGAYWSTTGKNTSNTDILCNPNPGLYPMGVEASGTGHRFYNNRIIQNTGYGMLLRPWNSSRPLQSNIISGYDPFCTGSCTYVPQYVENNAGCWAVGCYGSGWPASMGVAGININNTAAGPSGGTGTATNITLDHVRSQYNSRFGVSLYNISGGPGFTDTANGGVANACITGNSTNLVTSGSGSGYNAYSNLCP